MSIQESKEYLQNYIREQLKKKGLSSEQIEKVVTTVSSMKCMQSTESIDAFLKAAQ